MVTAVEERVLTGQHFMNGDTACAEGALAAGCTFFAGYPITPSTEIAERLAQRMPQLSARYVQMEDELASMAAILGASWAGVKAMTATSGPGFTLMMENFGLGLTATSSPLPTPRHRPRRCSTSPSRPSTPPSAFVPLSSSWPTK
jgi:pyruvate/2-oxoacid:ferredoxin oxidoreductase alpha subunit